LDLNALSAMVGRQLPLFSVIVPFWLVVAQVGWRGMREVWPACLVTGASFALSQFLVSNYVGPMLVDIISAAVSILALIALMKVWRPAEDVLSPTPPIGTAPPIATDPAPGPGWRAWLPWIFLSIFVFAWGWPAVKTFLNGLFDPKFNLPYLHNA